MASNLLKYVVLGCATLGVGLLALGAHRAPPARALPPPLPSFWRSVVPPEGAPSGTLCWVYESGSSLPLCYFPGASVTP